jgi:GTP cyclohydrolase IA
MPLSENECLSMKTDSASSTPALSTLSDLCRKLLEVIGEDPEREGLIKTPLRFARMIEELTRGYEETLTEVVGDAIFAESSRQIVVIRDIEFFSLCEHHILPFFGKVHVAYLPAGKVLGLSKIPRIVRMFSRRLQIQERMASQVACAVEEAIAPVGVACVIEAAHMCARMRGVENTTTSMATTVMKGRFETDAALRAEVLQLLKR